MPRDDTHSELAAVARPGVSLGHSLTPAPGESSGASPSGRHTLRRPTGAATGAPVDHRPRRPVVVVVSGGTVVVVSGGTVVGGAVVVVSGGTVVVVSGAVVAVTAGCVVVVAGARVGGVVVVDNSADWGRVDTFDALALGGVVVPGFLVVALGFFEGSRRRGRARRRQGPRRRGCRGTRHRRRGPQSGSGFQQGLAAHADRLVFVVHRDEQGQQCEKDCGKTTQLQQPPPFTRSHGPDVMGSTTD